MSGFKAFLLRGNVVDLAVAVVIGAAFGTVVSALVKDMITPLIAAVFGKPDFTSLAFTVNNSTFRYGDFINALVSFVLIAAVVYYLIVLPYTRFRSRFEKPPEPEPAMKKCAECLSDIPEAAQRCAFCASPQSAGAVH